MYSAVGAVLFACEASCWRPASAVSGTPTSECQVFAPIQTPSARIAAMRDPVSAQLLPAPLFGAGSLGHASPERRWMIVGKVFPPGDPPPSVRPPSPRGLLPDFFLQRADAIPESRPSSHSGRLMAYDFGDG